MKHISDILRRTTSRIVRSRMAKIFVSTIILIMSSTSRLMAKPYTSIILGALGLSALCTMYREIIPLWWCWAAPMAILIYLDTNSGLKAARYRIKNGSNERVTPSTLARRLANKVVSYGGWVFFSLSIGYLTERPMIGVIGILLSAAIELLSIVENHLETKGLGISWSGVWNAVRSAISSKTGIDLGEGGLITRKGGRGCGELPDETKQ